MKNIFLIIIGVFITMTIMTSCTQKSTYARMQTSMGEIVFQLFEDKTPLTVENFIGLAEGTKEWTDPKSGKKVKKPFYDGLIFHRVINDFMIQGGCPLGNGTGGPGYAFKDECYEKVAPATGKITDEATAIEAWNNILIPAMRKNGGKIADKKIMDIVNEVQQKNSGAPLIGQDLGDLQKRTGITWGKGSGLIAPVAYGTLCMANSGPDSNGSQFFIVTKKDGCDWLNGKHTVFGKVVSGMDVALKIEGVDKLPGDKPVKDVTIQKLTIERIQ